MKELRPDQNPRDFGKLDDEMALTQVLDDYKVSETFVREKFDLFIKLYKLYRSYIEQKDMRPHGANLFIPRVFSTVETVTPKIVNAIFDSRPFAKTIPVGDTPVEKSDKMDALLDFQLTQQMKIYTTLTDIVKTFLIYGTAITKQSWSFKTKKVIEQRPTAATLFGILGTEPVEVLAVAKDQPDIKLIPLLDFFPDPSAPNIEDGRYAIYRYHEDLHVLKEGEKDGKYKNIKEIAASSGSGTYGGQETMSDAAGLTESSLSRKDVEILEYWTDEWLVVVANQSTVIFKGPNPFHHREKPFARWIDHSVPGEFYGIGEAEPLEALQLELNTTRNQRIDNASMILNNMWLTRRGAQIDPEQLVSRPNGIIELDDIEGDIKLLEKRDHLHASYNEEATIKDDMDHTVGVFDSARGSSPGRRETATTMNILSTAAFDKFKLKILLTEEGGMHEAIMQIIKLNNQFVDHTLEMRILNEQGQLTEATIEPEDIMGQYDLKLVGGNTDPTINKEYRQNQMTQLYSLIREDPHVHQQAFLRRLLEAYDIKNVDELLTSPEQSPPAAMMQGGEEGMMGITPPPGAPQGMDMQSAMGMMPGEGGVEL